LYCSANNACRCQRGPGRLFGEIQPALRIFRLGAIHHTVTFERFAICCAQEAVHCNDSPFR
jgi:hypothetical protein